MKKSIYITKNLAFVLIALCISNSCEKNSPDSQAVVKTIYQKLAEVEDFMVTPITDNEGQFLIEVEQPVDHNSPNGPAFKQTVYITYVDTLAPVVFDPCGYAVSASMKSELSDLLGANDIHVGHRYFTGSKPENIDWQYLTIEQSAADHHRIIELLKEVFKGPWISSGGSKSGVATLYHRRYYPDDVKASVVFSAPFSRELKDPRYVEYIHTLGTEEEQSILKEYQRGLLLRRNELIPKVDSFVNTLEYTFSLTSSQMLDNEAFTFPFAYWQYYGEINKDDIPKADSSVEEYYQFFKPAIVYLSDQYLDYFRPSYYQRFTQMGDFKLDYEYLEDLLVDTEEPNQRFKAPQGVEMVYDPSTVDDIVDWLQNEGTEIIYIYGEYDPWTAGQIDISNTRDCLKIIEKGCNHTLRIEDLSESFQVLKLINFWLAKN